MLEATRGRHQPGSALGKDLQQQSPYELSHIHIIRVDCSGAGDQTDINYLARAFFIEPTKENFNPVPGVLIDFCLVA